MNELTIKFYDQHAEDFKAQYHSTSTKNVHKSWLDQFLPNSGVVLDVGAGTGRDALFFAEKGLDVFAIEPSKKLAQIGRKVTQEVNVEWVDDRLPDLQKVNCLKIAFDLILLSAVWMHVPFKSRLLAFETLSNLLASDGFLVISLRHGKSPDKREMFEVSIDEIKILAEKHNLKLCHAQRDGDSLNRTDVFWETVVLQK